MVLKSLTFMFFILVKASATKKLSPEDVAKSIGYAAKAILPGSGGPFSGKSSILAALSKVVVRKEKEAMDDLYDAMATFTNYMLNDRFLYMVGKEAVDNIAFKKEFKNTREAFSNYNSVLYSQLFELGRVADRRQTLVQMENALYFIKRAFSDELYQIPDKSSILGNMKKIKTWAKKEDLSEVLTFAFDVISLRVNLRLLRLAIDKHEWDKIAAHCLGLSAGVIGLEDFVASVASDIRLLSEKGMLIGGMMNVAVTFINIHEHGNEKEAQSPVKIDFESQSAMEALGEHSKKQLRKLMLFVTNQDIGLSDIYVVNQGVLPKWGILFGEDRGPLQFGAFKNGSEGDSPIYRKEDSSDVFLVGGKPRRVLKAQQPQGDKETDIVGFDFIGTFAQGYPYIGSTIFVSTENIHSRDYRLNGLKINTCLQKNWFHPSDHLLITDMANLDQGEKIEVNMGKGDDVLIISGMLGGFGNGSEGLLDVDLGVGLNTLSFEGMNRKRKDIKGVFFDSRNGKLSFFHGLDARLHNIGIVQSVHVFFGSPFNDYVILSGVVSGNPNGYDLTVIQHSGKNFYEVDIDKILESTARKRFKVIDNSNKKPTIVIRTSKNITRNELIFVGNVFEVYKQKTRDSPVESIVSVHIIAKDVPMIKLVDANDVSIMSDIKSNFLGPEFVSGLSIATKGMTVVNGSEQNDVCVMECKIKEEIGTSENADIVMIDLGPGEDMVVLKDSTFIEPCGINSEDFNVWLEPKDEDEGDGSENGEWYIKIEKNQTVMKTYLLKNVEKIVNAFGSLIVNLANEKRTSANLLTTYISVTSHEIGLSK